MSESHPILRAIITLMAIWMAIVLITEGIYILPISALVLIFIRMLVNAYELGAGG